MNKVNLVLGVMSACFLLFGAALFFAMSTAGDHLPKPQSILVWLPPDAEVYPREQVQAGTFKFILPLSQFQQEVTKNPEQRPIVVYSGLPAYPSTSPYLEYWLPRENGTFSYSKEYLPNPPSGVKVSRPWKWSVVWDAQLDRETASFVYTPRAYPLWFFFGGILSSLFGIVTLINIRRRA